MMQVEIPEHPGVILKKRFLDPLGISPSDLAESIGVSRRRIAELIKGRRMSPDMAHRLGHYFQVPPLWFLEMQARFDTQTTAVDSRSLKTWEPKRGILITPRGAVDLGKPKTEKVETLLVTVPDDLLDRLRQQAQLSRQSMRRTTKVVTLPDGTPMLTGE